MKWGPFDMQGRGVAVTGGGGHLGSAIAFMLADAGATVLIIGRSEDRLQRVTDQYRGDRGRVIPCVGDLGRDDDVSHALDVLYREVGRIDGLVNNAYSGSQDRLLEYSREEIEHTLASVTDVLMATQQVARRMIEDNTPGAVVNIASMYGSVSPYPDVYRDHEHWHNPPSYGAAKASLLQFTRYASVHLAPYRVRVNSVTPGPFPNPAVQTDTVFVQRLAERVPMGRIGQPKELAGAVLFLLSEAASYITGANLVVDGGWTAW